MESYRTLYEGKTAQIVEKKSRFIADIAHVESEEEAQEFLSQIRKTYWDARHHCSAFILGKRQEVKRCSDDGEPAQTAGKPMLDVLTGEGLCDTIAVVTRYFGGTLLGTGGLVKAYTEAVKAGLAASTVITKIPAVSLQVTVTYNQIGKLLYIVGQHGYPQLHSDYAADVSLTLLVPEKEETAMRKELTEAFGGSAVVQGEAFGYYAVQEGKLITFPEGKKA